jgi:hypothetical protein
VFSNSNGQESRQARKLKAQTGSVNAPRNESRQQPHKVSLQEAESWIVMTTKTIKIAPRVKQIVVGKIELPKCRVSPDMVCVEPAQLPFEGLLAARGLARIVTKQPDRGQRRTVTPSTSRSSQLAGKKLGGEPTRDREMIVNFNHDVIELPKACYRHSRRNFRKFSSSY